MVRSFGLSSFDWIQRQIPRPGWAATLEAEKSVHDRKGKTDMSHVGVLSPSWPRFSLRKNILLSRICPSSGPPRIDGLHASRSSIGYPVYEPPVQMDADISPARLDVSPPALTVLAGLPFYHHIQRPTQSLARSLSRAQNPTVLEHQSSS